MPFDIDPRLIAQTPFAPGGNSGGGSGVGGQTSGMGAVGSGSMGLLGMLAPYLLGKQKPAQLAITPGQSQGQTLDGQNVQSMPTYTQTAPSAHQPGLLGGFEQFVPRPDRDRACVRAGRRRGEGVRPRPVEDGR